MSVELGHFRGFANQAVEAVRFLIDDSQQLLALRLVQVVIGEQARDRGLDAGQRSTEFVSYGIE